MKKYFFDAHTRMSYNKTDFVGQLCCVAAGAIPNLNKHSVTSISSEPGDLNAGKSRSCSCAGTAPGYPATGSTSVFCPGRSFSVTMEEEQVTTDPSPGDVTAE